MLTNFEEILFTREFTKDYNWYKQSDSLTEEDYIRIVEMANNNLYMRGLKDIKGAKIEYYKILDGVVAFRTFYDFNRKDSCGREIMTISGLILPYMNKDIVEDLNLEEYIYEKTKTLYTDEELSELRKSHQK